MLCRRAASTLGKRTFSGAARPVHPGILSATANDNRSPAPHTLNARHFTPSRPVAAVDPLFAVGIGSCSIAVGVWVSAFVSERTKYQVFDRVVMPVVRRRGTEKADSFLRSTLAKGLLPKLSTWTQRLEDWQSNAERLYALKKIWSPQLGIAAAMDPEGKTLPRLARLGLSFVEIGPITLKPQGGNAVAHSHALVVGDRATVDCYVIPSQGVVKAYFQLKKWRKAEPPYNEDVILMVHVAQNDDSDDPADDIRRGMTWLVDVADFFVVSFPSSILHLPRDRRAEAMGRFCMDIGAKQMDPNRYSLYRDGCDMPKPLLLKLQPDLSSEQLHDIASVAVSHDVSGLVVCGNMRAGGASGDDGTVCSVCGTRSSPPAAGGNGFKEVSTRMVHEMYAFTGGKLPIIASGAVANAEDAYEKIRAGASLVQVGQALLVDHGLGSVFKIREGLIDLAHADCYKKLEHAVGADHKKRRPKEIEQA